MKGSSQSFSGRTALVTGAGSGIGRVIAIELANAGVHVLVQDLRVDEAAAVAMEIRDAGGAAASIGGDVSNPNGVAAMVDALIRSHDRVDILINNAGFQYIAPIEAFPLEQWNSMLGVLLTGPFLLTQAVLPSMRRHGWGRIINISSVNGSKGAFGQTNYSAAKAGIHGFTKALALECAAKGVTVNTVSPGYLATRMTRDIPEDVMQQRILPQIPLGRLGRPEEVAALVAFLCTEDAAYLTGANLAVNGGLHMQ